MVGERWGDMLGRGWRHYLDGPGPEEGPGDAGWVAGHARLGHEDFRSDSRDYRTLHRWAGRTLHRWACRTLHRTPAVPTAREDQGRHRLSLPREKTRGGTGCPYRASPRALAWRGMAGMPSKPALGPELPAPRAAAAGRDGAAACMCIHACTPARTETRRRNGLGARLTA
jgi:hypothetical protein